MKMNWKRWTAAALVSGLAAAGLPAAGGAEEEEAVRQAAAPAGQFPIVQEPMTIKAFLAPWGNTDDYQDNEFIRYLEEKTNIRLEVDIARRGPDAEQKKGILLAGGDYPEVFIDGLFSKAEQQFYGGRGVFIPLNDLIAEYGVNTRKLFAEYPLVKANMTMPDGSIYSLPDVNDCFHCSYNRKMWIYQPWLDKLGLEMPRTTEDFRNVLIAFRDRDPNGNGLADEIPLSGSIKNRRAGVDGFIMNAFVYTHGNIGETQLGRMFIEDGRVQAAFNQPAWKDGLAYMNDLFREKLLSADAFVQDPAQYKQLGENPDIVLLGAGTAGHQGLFTNFYGESGRWLEYKAVPPLEGPGGERISPYDPVYGDVSWTITDRAANPEAAFRLGDAFYEDDLMLHAVTGRQGIEWDWAEPGEIGINGLQAIWKILENQGETPDNITWDQAGPQNRSSAFRLGQMSGGLESLEVILFDESKVKMEPYRVNLDMIVPPLTYGEDTAVEVVELENSLRDYVNEMIARFTVGDVDIEDDWDDYLAELERIGLPRYIELMQEAYDNR